MRWRLATAVVLLLQVPVLADNENATKEVTNRALAFFYTAAEWIGEGLVRLVDLVLPAPPPPGIAGPLGYLGLLTLILLVFGLIDAARKVIGFLVGIGWILMVVRIFLHTVGIT